MSANMNSTELGSIEEARQRREAYEALRQSHARLMATIAEQTEEILLLKRERDDFRARLEELQSGIGAMLAGWC